MKSTKDKICFALGYIVPWELLFTGDLFMRMNETAFASFLLLLGLFVPFATLLTAGKWARARDDLKVLWYVMFFVQVLRTAIGGMTFLEDGGWYFWNYGAGAGPAVPMAIFVPSIGGAWLRLVTIPLGAWFIVAASRDETEA